MAKKHSSKPKPKPVKKVKPSTPARNWLTEANAFLGKYSRWVAGFVFGLSLLLSAIYYLQAKDSAIMSYHRWTNSDMAFFDEWGQYLAKGDIWCDTLLHPFHNWHNDLAGQYFDRYPDIKAQYRADESNTDSARRALINDIYKGKTYHQEPLYAYMLAATYSIFGHDVKWVYFWQFLLAAFTSVLVFLVGKNLFNPLTGLLASLFVTLCGTIMIFEMTLLRTTMTNFFTILLLYLFLIVLEKPTLKKQIVFGAASGIALLGQSFLILFLLPAWGWFLWTHRKSLKEILPGFAANIAALLLMMMPLFIRNVKVDVPVTALASQGAMAYIPMNIKETYPMESFYIHMPSLVQIRHDSGGKMLRAVGECLKTFDNFSSFWKVYKQKINGLFMWYEIPNNVNYYLFSEIAPVLKAMPVRYFFIAPLGLVGLAFGIWRYRWKMLPIILLTVVSITPMMIAGNLARYRTPLVILLAILAAFFIVEMLSQLYQKNYKAVGIGLVASVLAFLYTSNTVDKNIFTLMASDIDTFYRYHYMDRLVAMETSGDTEGYYQLTSQMV
ncbi:MAG: glycosyltransferase family 39 protein, partial [Saprospiraceae bacterium]